MNPKSTCTILGVKFFTGSSERAVDRGLLGGLVVVPSAPGLMEVVSNREYREALTSADMVLTDSAFMVLFWRLLTGEKLPRTSGLRYLRHLVTRSALQNPDRTVWIMPSLVAARRAMRWLRSINIPVGLSRFYIAPAYAAGPVDDPELLTFVRESNAEHILVGLGGGTQEKVGLYLKENLPHNPGIHCLGAAIGFLTGDQVHIPNWVDRFGLGWLLRCLDQPARFIPRYVRGSKLGWLLWKYRELSPVS